MSHPQRIVFARIARSLAFVFWLAVSGCQMMSGHASNNLGTAYFREGNYAAAQRSFRQAVVEMPENPDFRYNLAATMQRQGNLAGAEQVYRQALHIDPSHHPSYHGLAEMMVKQGRHADASAILGTWVATQPYSPAPHIEMAWLQQRQGNTSAATQSLETALKLHPNHPAALAQLGQIYQSSGQPETAVAYYERSLQANWRQPEVQKRLAELKPNSRPQNRTQVAFGGPQPARFPQRNPVRTAWQPSPNPRVAWPTPASARFAAAPQTPPTALPQQVQTTWMPPQSAAPQFAMPTPVQQGQPTPVGFPQAANGSPTLATTPANADPAHIPQATAEAPVVRPY